MYEKEITACQFSSFFRSSFEIQCLRGTWHFLGSQSESLGYTVVDRWEE